MKTAAASEASGCSPTPSCSRRRSSWAASGTMRRGAPPRLHCGSSRAIPSRVWVAADVDKCLQLVPMYWLVAPLLLKKQQQLGWRRHKNLARPLVVGIWNSSFSRTTLFLPGGCDVGCFGLRWTAGTSQRAVQKGAAAHGVRAKIYVATRGAVEISQTSNWDLNVAGYFSNSSLHR